jgi:transposase
MTKRKNRRSFSSEFKAKAVSLCRSGERSIAQVAQDLDLVESALRRWISQADVNVGKGPAGALTSDEKAELAQLRREVKRLKEEREILKAAATFFAKESK